VSGIDAPSDRARTASVQALMNAAAIETMNSGPGRICSFGRPISAIHREPNTAGRRRDAMPCSALGAGHCLLREHLVEERRDLLPRQLLGLVPPLHESLFLLALTLAELDLEFLELSQKSVAEPLLFRRELGLDPLAFRPAPRLEARSLIIAPTFELGVKAQLGGLVAPPRFDELRRERAVQPLSEIPRLLVRPDLVRLLTSPRDRFALEALPFSDSLLSFGALTLDGLHELCAAGPHLDVKALERRCATSRKLRSECSGRRVDDLERYLFGHRVRQWLGIEISGTLTQRRRCRCRESAFLVPHELAACGCRVRPFE
jgi:hypothetical protein